jgi:hypothetical protein
LMDMGYAASLEQSLSIANEINFIRESLEKREIPEDYRIYLERMMTELQSMHSVTAMELRLLTGAGQIYGLTKAPEG